MLIRLKDLNGNPVYINPDNVLFVGPAQDKGAMVVNGSAVAMIGGINVLVKGDIKTVAELLDPNLVKELVQQMFGRFFQDWYQADLDALLQGRTRYFQKEPPIYLILGVILLIALGFIEAC